jgi:hypothetical protein
MSSYTKLSCFPNPAGTFTTISVSFYFSLDSPLSILYDHSFNSISREFSMTLISLPAEKAKMIKLEIMGRIRKVVK